MFDIIIVNYKSTALLMGCLKSIYEASEGYPIKVFVEDNASRDGVEEIEAAYPEVTLTIHSYNLGFGRAINSSLEKSSSPYVLILNPDTVVETGFFSTAIAFMEANQGVGILGPQILDQDGSIQGSARKFPTPLTALFGRKSLLTRAFPNNRITQENILTTKSDGWSPMEVDWVSGACMLVRRQAVMDVGPLDSRFFMYWEDADWCRRMWQAGWKVVYYPRAKIVHYVGASSEKNVFRSVLEFHKSCHLLFKKYVSPGFRFFTSIAFWLLIFRFFFVMTGHLIRRPLRVLGFEGYERLPFVGRERRRIKILRIIARLNIGGPSIHVHILTSGLDRRRFRSILVTGKISPSEGDMSYLFASHDSKPIIVKELQREISLRMDIKAFLSIFRIIRRESPDIVHSHTAKAGTSARIAVYLYNFLYGRNVKMVHTFHGHVFEGYFSPGKARFFVWVERMLGLATDVIIAISESQRKELTERFRIAPLSKVATLELGFNLSPFLECSAARGRFRKSLGINPDTPLVGIVGRLVPIKNHLMFFDAAARLASMMRDRPLAFAVVGDGELRHELEDYCREKGLSEQVRFCGWVRDVAAVYADLDVLALTSLNEGTPVSIIEAMASSVSVIATDVGGVHDLLGRSREVAGKGYLEAERGLLCANNNSAGFAEGILSILEGGPGAKAARVIEARRFVEEKYSEKRLLRDVESLYERLVEK
ncbi:glycosyltransferase [bacterium]|nr:glycosyltransferase [bacterium]OIP42683.1 MAG: hypothetical protein AUK25_03425 [Desulfobacteraceae bacterium CG2_30_51_40]